MGDLSVTVRLHGHVVEDRVLSARRVVRIGEASSAAVSFPGADLCVVRVGDFLSLQGHLLDEGEELRLSLGPVDVLLHHMAPTPVLGEWSSLFDFRFFSVTLMVVSMGTWIDASELWLERQAFALSPDLLKQAVAVIEARGEGGVDQRAASVSATTDRSEPVSPLPPLAEGPTHEPDDAQTGTAWYQWYRHSVPDDDAQLAEAYERFSWDPHDAAARRVLARAAYDADDFESASAHYSWLLDNFPQDTDLRVRFARSEKRLGRHAAEVRLYREVLQRDANHASALSGLVLALGRMNRFDEAAMLLDQLQVVAPHSPYTDVTVAQIAAMTGQDRSCIEALERAFTGRTHLSREMQIEFRRDLALDPVFAALRKDQRLRSLVHRHLGAAGPLPAR